MRAVVNKKAKKSLKEFFPWVYRSDIISYEIKENGDIVKIFDEGGAFLAVGYLNPKSVISIRVLSFKDEKIDKAFFQKRVKRALEKRNDIPSDAFRLIHSEADMLPGVIIDKYGEYISLQINTFGAFHLKEPLLEVVLEEFAPKGIVVDGDCYNLQKEGLTFKRYTIGEVPQEVVFEENGIKFCASLLEGQKTGFYLDQRRNRQRVTNYLKKRSKVLDLFCNVGGFGLYGALKKEAEVELVDISKEAIELAKQNFALNGVDGEFVCANVFDYLRVLRKKKQKFDLIIIDPPSFAKTKAQKAAALRGFKDLMVNGMKLVEEGGFVALFSCSYYVDEQDLVDIALKASKDTKRRVEVIEVLSQDIDHPSIINIPFSRYLKGFLFRIE